MTSNLSQIGNVKIAVVDYYAARELFASDHPHLELILVNSTQEGLKKVTFGEVLGFVSDLPVASYWSSKAGLADLKDAGELPYKHQISFASSKYEPQLHGILEKSLAEIDVKTREEIHNRWIIGPFSNSLFLKMSVYG